MKFLKIAVLSFVLTFMYLVACHAEGRTYNHLKNTRQLVTTHRTHVEVIGLVLAIINEDDGDLHIRLTDGTVTKCDVPAYMSGACIVAEIRPGTDTYHAKVGEWVLVRGVSRYDREHKWWEIHPADYVEVTNAR